MPLLSWRVSSHLDLEAGAEHNVFWGHGYMETLYIKLCAVPAADSLRLYERALDILAKPAGRPNLMVSLGLQLQSLWIIPTAAVS